MSTRLPNEVFTPRSHALNERMYIARDDLESALVRELRGNKHIIVHGESGSGKSWLYKRVAISQKASLLIADLANASRFGSITKEFQNLLDRREQSSKKSYTEKKKAGVSTGFLSAELDHIGQYKLSSKEPFEKCLELLQKSSRNKMAILVWDNFERLLGSQKLIREAADIISLADNPDYAHYGVKILIVGVPSDIRSYIASSDNSNTIANRLAEIPEVARLTKSQTLDFVTRGFITEMGYRKDKYLWPKISSHVSYVTDRIPQHLHEYCLELAQIGEENDGSIGEDDLSEADARWLASSLVHSYSVVESHMNARNTAAGRKNQAIYAIGSLNRHDFDHSDVEYQVRKEFQSSTSGKSLNIPQILQSLASGQNPLIKRTPKGNAYRLINPKVRMCIRTMLAKDLSGARVTKRELQSS